MIFGILSMKVEHLRHHLPLLLELLLFCSRSLEDKGDFGMLFCE